MLCIYNRYGKNAKYKVNAWINMHLNNNQKVMTSFDSQQLIIMHSEINMGLKMLILTGYIVIQNIRLIHKILSKIDEYNVIASSQNSDATT